MVGWLIVLTFIGLLALIVIRVAPVYMEAYTVRSILQSLQEERSLVGADRNAVWRTLQKRLEINDVKSVGRDDISLQAVGGGTQITIAYESRFPLLANIDGIANFTTRVTIRH